MISFKNSKTTTATTSLLPASTPLTSPTFSTASTSTSLTSLTTSLTYSTATSTFTTPSTSTSLTSSTTSTSLTFSTLSNIPDNHTFMNEPYYITALVIVIAILFGLLVAYKLKNPAAAVDPPAVNILLRAFNTLSNFVTTNTVSQATANFVHNLSNHITGLYPTAQTAPTGQPQNNSTATTSDPNNSIAISISNTPARRQSVSVDSSLPHPSPSTSHSTSGNSSLSSTPNHPSTSITIDNSSHSVRFYHRYNLRSTPLRNN